MTIYHIVLPEIWANFKDKNFYEAESLQTEGFIHCSFENQIAGVLERYYKGIEQILVLHLETEKLTAKLVNEPSTNNEVYPHIYGQINREAIIKIEEKDLATN
jgi:uncharacterized protein (DUF952 family)